MIKAPLFCPLVVILSKKSVFDGKASVDYFLFLAKELQSEQQIIAIEIR